MPAQYCHERVHVMDKLSWIIKKTGHQVHDRLVGQLHQTLSLHTKVRVISGHKHICMHASGQRAQCHIFNLHNQTSPHLAHGWREDGDGWSRDISYILTGQDASSQASEQIWEVISAVCGRAGGNYLVCVHRLRVGHRERGVHREASASSGARSGCGCHGGLHGWDQVRLC